MKKPLMTPGEALYTPWYSRYPAKCLFLALGYFALAVFCIDISASESNHIARVWWPNALVLGILLRTRPSRWWGFVLADLAGNVSANLVMGYHPLLSPALALCDLAEIGVCLWLLRRLIPQWNQTLNLRNFLTMLGVILGVGAVVSATLASLVLHYVFDAPVASVWPTWWMAECIGMISLLPIVALFSQRRLRELFQPGRRWEFLAISVFSIGTAVLAMARMPFPLIVLTIPLLIAALRLNFLGTAVNGLLVFLVILLMSSLDHSLLKSTPLIQSGVQYLAARTLLIASAVLVLGPLLVSLLVEQLRLTITQLHQSKKIFRDSMECASIGMLLIDAQGHCFRGNPAAAQLLGYSEEELSDIHMSRLANPDDIPNISREVNAVAAGETDKCSFERLYVRKDGTRFWARVSVAAARDDEQQFLYFITQIEDIEERKHEESRRAELQKELEYRARHDSLTGLLNRASFEQTLSDMLAGRNPERRQHSVCFIDLDRFKILNDSAGHAAGDMLLRQIAQRLLLRVRSHDVLARLGGDEFGLILPDCSAEHARRICRQLINEVNDINFSWEGSTFTIGASIGVVPFAAGDIALAELMSRADVACYSAKNEGRNCVVIYDDNDSVAARNHQQIQVAASIREALEAGRFTLYAQQITSLKPEIKARPIELLVRLRTREGELVSPAVFIPAAERYGLMADIDRWVIAHALIEHGHALSRIDGLHVSINLSGTSFNDADFAEYLRAVIRNTPISPKNICFEITETAVVNNIARASQLMQLLQEEGCLIALDDFGSGLSSFSYLKNFPADVIKIDGNFVKTLIENPIDRAIIESINQIAHQLGARTVAEFVENEAVANALQLIGIDYAQGYYYSRPEPLAGMIQRLAPAPANNNPAPNKISG